MESVKLRIQMETKMYIPQIALEYLRKHVIPQKVVVIYGARRIGNYV